MKVSTLAVDIGAAVVKAAASVRKGHRTGVLPSRIARGLRAGQTSGVMVHESSGGSFRVGDVSDAAGVRLNDVPDSMRGVASVAAFVAAAAHQLGVSVCRTLVLVRDEDMSHDEVDALFHHLGELTIGDSAPLVVERVCVIDRVGALTADVGLSIRGDEEDAPYVPATFALCDFGAARWRVHVVSLVESTGAYDVEGRSLALDGAIESMFFNMVVSRFGHRLNDVQERMAEGEIRIAGARKIVAPMVAQARAEAAEAETAELVEFLAECDVEAIYVAGGHASVAAHVLASVVGARSITCAEPICATARGALKASRRFEGVGG